jgi:cell division septum initiation protein DivIVA
MNEYPSQTKDLLEVVEASDRAGALVAQHVRAIVDAAEADAARIRERAEEDARRIVRQAADAAARVLAEIDALDGPLSETVAGLRRQADQLTADPGPEA